MERQLSLLTFRAFREEPLPLAAAPLLLAIHCLGLALVAAHYGHSYLWALNLYLLLASPMAIYSLLTRRRGVYLEALTPLAFLYLVVALNRVASNLAAAPEYEFIYSRLFNSDVALLASGAYAILCQLYTILSQRRGEYLRIAGISLLGLTLLWAGAEYLGQRTRGVTASDPYAYVQMAVDLVERGSPWHLFPLFPEVSGLGVSWWPLLHVGYHLPHDGLGRAATVWPVGGSLPLALGYLLLGEEGLYIITPLIGLLCLGAIYALMAQILHRRPPEEKVWAGALAAFILATSYEQIDRLLVPMADASAQLLTLLAILFTLKGVRGRHRIYAFLAGLSFGGAYLVRHTQLVVGISVLLAVAILGGGRSRRERLEFLLLFGLVSSVMAIPDLIYHQLSFGHFLRPESEELTLFALSNVALTAPRVVGDLLRGNEFGYLIPFLLYGAYRLYREERGLFLVLGIWAGAVILFHLPYRALRLRDLLSAYPALIALVVYGMVEIWRRAAQSPRGLLAALALFLTLLLPAYRTRVTLAEPFLSTTRATFGSMTRSQREAFDLLAAYTPPGSVIGTSLNGGAIDLYAGRQAFRPHSWSGEELDIFISAMGREGREVYILDDSSELAPMLNYLSSSYRLAPVVRLDIPLFGDQERATGYLYRVEER